MIRSTVTRTFLEKQASDVIGAYVVHGHILEHIHIPIMGIGGMLQVCLHFV